MLPSSDVDRSHVVDAEAYLRWLETGEGPEPCGDSRDNYCRVEYLRTDGYWGPAGGSNRDLVLSKALRDTVRERPGPYGFGQAAPPLFTLVGHPDHWTFTLEEYQEYQALHEFPLLTETQMSILRCLDRDESLTFSYAGEDRTIQRFA